MGVRRRQQGQLDQHKRLQALAIALLAGLLLFTQAGVAAAQTGDRVTGYGNTDFGGQFSFDIHADETGANPTGTYHVTGPPESFDANPKCMRLRGDRATLGLSIDATRSLLLWVRETAGSGTIYARIVGASEPIACPDPLAGPAASLAALGVGGFVDVEDVQPPPAPGTDSVTGEISQCFFHDVDGGCGFFGSFSPGAVSRRLGGDPAGAFSFDQSGATPGAATREDAAVTCLSVNGRQATIGFTGSRHRYGAGEAIYPYAGLVHVTDGAGAADSVQFAVENGTRNGPLLPGPTDCSSFPGAFPLGPGAYNFDDASGDLVVHDALTRPQARAACIFERVAHGVAAFRAKYGRMRNCVALYLA